MRNDKDILGDFAVYPGHPLTIAYLVVCKYASLEQALGIPDGSPHPGALGDNDIPGAGGNVSNALHLLKLAVEGTLTLDEMVVQGDDTWGKCDAMAKGGNNPADPKFGRDYYLRRFREGQEQADTIKEKLKEQLPMWPKTQKDAKKKQP